MRRNIKQIQNRTSPSVGWGVMLAKTSDYAKILEIQKNAFHSEAVLYNIFNIQPITQTLDEITEECKDKVFLK